ncbi:type II toxin-antitoxin system RelE/ParE family toxin [Alloacidobacterium dinghuense]|uniref:Type II toxin-antitoxin system RelE/ParE family toxin n=1 Tax=Alloacidobacterium dinghuense TaxID=2763107 RepID=A0A7G8BDR4_9BACT|nr:type II toxin-antitoxin system RelE/ParE family toxin [Alloacidobacterium dinghuense]QNI30684.1 type II toxin-antitoxin system RelE/ParE family toxin [Alloacidobacterium dinghuense]
MTRYLLSPEAVEDLQSIKNFLEEDAGVRVARYVLKELREGMRFLAERPGAGHTREDLTDHPVRFLPVFSYLIVYREQNQLLEVVRVLHGNRNLRALLK